MTMRGDDRLSEREHIELRDLVLAGAQRVDAARPRRHLVAASIALVLVGGLIGGSVVAVTGLIEHSDTRVADETSGLPFGGDCADAAGTEDRAVIDDRAPFVLEEGPRAGAADVLGGIECAWSREGDAGRPARVWIAAYPERIVSVDAASAVQEPACVEFSPAPAMTSCSVTGVVDGMRLAVGVLGDQVQGGEDAVDALFAHVAERLVAAPGEGPPIPGSDWWSPPECSALVSGIVADRAAEAPPITLGPDELALPSGLTSELQRDAGAARACALEFSVPGDASAPNGVRLEVVPGGAVAFDSVRSSAGAEAVTVPGASEGFLVALAPVTGDGAPKARALIVTDGVNVLVLTPSDPGPEASELIALAASLLDRL